MNWITGTLGSSIGKKLLMAITGLSFIGFLAAHLAGNLTIYGGKDAFNGYAEHLHALGPLLTVAELVLLTFFSGSCDYRSDPLSAKSEGPAEALCSQQNRRRPDVRIRHHALYGGLAAGLHRFSPDELSASSTRPTPPYLISSPVPFPIAAMWSSTSWPWWSPLSTSATDSGALFRPSVPTIPSTCP
jgi:hypothetical protein